LRAGEFKEFQSILTQLSTAIPRASRECYVLIDAIEDREIRIDEEFAWKFREFQQRLTDLVRGDLSLPVAIEGARAVAREMTEQLGRLERQLL
jgi:hypothetical protein